MKTRKESESTIFMTVKRDWEAIDFSSPKLERVVIPIGRHQMERIPSPKYEGVNLLVLKGTMIGASESSWLQWRNGIRAGVPGHPNFGKPIEWGEYEVVIEEDGKNLTIEVPPETAVV